MVHSGDYGIGSIKRWTENLFMFCRMGAELREGKGTGQLGVINRSKQV